MQHALFDGYAAKMKMQTDNKFIDQARVKRPVFSIPLNRTNRVKPSLFNNELFFNTSILIISIVNGVVVILLSM